jgi:hypothetical protein
MGQDEEDAMEDRKRRWVRAVGLVALAASLATGSLPALAQEGTPEAAQSPLHDATAAVYEGTCDNLTATTTLDLGTVQHYNVVDLGEQARQELLDELANPASAVASGTPGPPGTVPQTGILVKNVPEVWLVESDATFDPNALFDENHAIAVRQSEGNGGGVIACGVLGGVGAQPEGQQPNKQQFFFNLQPAAGQRYHGFAVFGLDSEVNDKGIRVTLFTLPAQVQNQDATPAATPPTS